MNSNLTGALMGLTTRFAAELEQLSTQGKNKEPVSAKVDPAIAVQLRRGKLMTGKSESLLIEECLKSCLDLVIRKLVREREEAEAAYEREFGHSATQADPAKTPSRNMKQQRLTEIEEVARKHIPNPKEIPDKPGPRSKVVQLQKSKTA